MDGAPCLEIARASVIFTGMEHENGTLGIKEGLAINRTTRDIETSKTLETTKRGTIHGTPIITESNKVFWG